MSRTIVHISATDGHHPSYQDVFVTLLNGEASTGSIRSKLFWKLVREPSVFFATIDADYLGFIAVALVRAISGKNTSGIFLRPLQCFRSERPLIYPAKRVLFRWISKIPRINLLSIIPHYLHPELREVTNNWIYDPQMWDLWLDGPPNLPDTPLSRRVESEARGRRIVIYIGAATTGKGFLELGEFAQNNNNDYLIVVGGKISPEYNRQIQKLLNSGMIIVNRYITDEEILSLYKVAHYAWCKYLPAYDQPSGVFGRATQTNVIPLVREGSLIDDILKYSKHKSPKDKLDRDLAIIMNINSTN